MEASTKQKKPHRYNQLNNMNFFPISSPTDAALQLYEAYAQIDITARTKHTRKKMLLLLILRGFFHIPNLSAWNQIELKCNVQVYGCG